jgi:hypothetical protein
VASWRVFAASFSDFLEERMGDWQPESAACIRRDVREPTRYRRGGKEKIKGNKYENTHSRKTRTCVHMEKPGHQCPQDRKQIKRTYFSRVFVCVYALAKLFALHA